MKKKLLLLAASLPVMAASVNAQTVLVPWNQPWKYMHPMGTLPDRPAGGADVDFETTWYLSEPDFVAQYDGPTFGAVPRQSGDPVTLNSYDSGVGPGPLGYDIIDYLAGAVGEMTAFGKLPADVDPSINNPDSVLTRPADLNRRAAYFRTTFEITGPDTLVKPSIRMLMDDGCYIYIDGVKIAAVNMPTTNNNDIYAQVNATAATVETALVTLDLFAAPDPAAITRVITPLLSLAPGTHTLAISARSNSQSSSDMGMGFELSAQTGGVIVAVASNITRDDKGTPAPADDEFSFSVTVNQSGIPAGTWTADLAASDTTLTGPYGVTKAYGPFPVSDNTKTITYTDSANPAVTSTVIVTAPPYVHKVTAANSPKITFDLSAVGDGSFVPSAAGAAEPGWTGGTAGADTLSNVQVQPLPSAQTLKYFHLTTNAVSFTTEAVDVSAVKGALLAGELDVAFYSTSATGLDAGDVLNFRLEVAQDGNFGNTAGGNVITANIRDVPAGDAPAFGDSIPAAVPHINLATVGYPATDFTFYKLSASVLVPAGATNPTARIVVQSITGISNSEHVLLDNIVIRSNSSPSLSASTGSAIWTNNGTVTTADDSFSVPVTVTSFNIGASPGWNSNEVPVRSGAYTDPNPVTFGPYPGRTPVSVQLSDQLNPAVQTSVLNLAPPGATLTAALVAGPIVRNENGPGDADDTVTFDVTVASTNAGPAFTATPNFVPAVVSGAGNYPAGGTAVLTLSNLPAAATTINVVIADASYPTAPAPITIAVAIPAPTAPGPVVVGRKDFGSGLSSVMATGVPGPEWLPFPATRELAMTTGIATDSIVESEVIDLSTVGAVNFSAKLVAKDNSVGSNFEITDRFKAELIIDGGINPADIINLVDTFDVGDGTSATAAATNGLNGPKNGYINGYSGTAALDLISNINYAVAPLVAEDEYNANRARDEFNSAGEVADTALNNIFNLSAVVPAGANSVQLKIYGAGAAGSEALIVKDVLFSSTSAGDADGDGVSDANETIMGTNPNDASDVLRLSQVTGNPTQISFPTKAGRFYRVYVSDDANEPTHLTVWKDSGLPTIIGDGNAKQFSINVSPAESRRFHRLHVMTTDGAWPPVVP